MRWFFLSFRRFILAQKSRGRSILMIFRAFFSLAPSIKIGVLFCRSKVARHCWKCRFLWSNFLSLSVLKECAEWELGEDAFYTHWEFAVVSVTRTCVQIRQMKISELNNTPDEKKRIRRRRLMKSKSSFWEMVMGANLSLSRPIFYKNKWF